MKNKRRHTPVGLKDFLPKQQAFKLKIERKIEDIFCSYGYSAVSGPSFEYAEVFESIGRTKNRSMYKFIDNGEVLALRSDLTPSIARIAAVNYSKEDIPLRFSYIGNTFRNNESYQNKLKEFTQAGIELIGVNSAAADAEVIAVAINTLLASGLKEFRIDIGQVDFLHGLIAEAAFRKKDELALKEAIANRCYADVADIVSNYDMPAETKHFFSHLHSYIGDDTVLQSARGLVKNERALEALDNLGNIYEILKEYHLDNYVSFDLSILGHLDYYTGLIFCGYTYGVGASILDGGRYDNLMAEFGEPCPSVGFSIKINNLLLALELAGEMPPYSVSETLLAYTDEGRQRALETADILRSHNYMRIENSLFGGDIEKNIHYAKNKGIAGILFFLDDENVELYNLETGQNDKVKISDLLISGGI